MEQPTNLFNAVIVALLKNGKSHPGKLVEFGPPGIVQMRGPSGELRWVIASRGYGDKFFFLKEEWVGHSWSGDKSCLKWRFYWQAKRYLDKYLKDQQPWKPVL